MNAPDSQTATSLPALCRWALGYARRRWPGMAAVLGLTLLRIGLDLIKPWPMKVLVDHALGGRPLGATADRWAGWLLGGATPPQLILGCAGATVVIFLLGWLVASASAMANIGFGQHLVYDLAADLFAHLQRLSLRFHYRKAVGDSIRRVTRDSTCVAAIIKDGLLPVVTSVGTLAIMFLILWRLNWVLTLTALAVVPFLALVLRRYTRPMMELSYQQQEAEGRMYSVVEQTLAAIPVVKAFTHEEEAVGHFQASTDASLDATLAATRVQLWFKTLIGLATAIGTAVVLWLGAREVLAGRLTVGSILVFLSYLGSLYAPLESLAYTSSNVQDTTGSARRVIEILGAEPDVQDRPQAVPLGPVRGAVCIENVTYGYEPGRPILHDVTLETQPGQTVAIVGPTGAGKSTLAGLVPRFFDPWQGRVLVDGHDVRDVRLRDLREQVGLVLQEPLLLPLSVAENIAYGKPEATPAEIVAAAVAANADEFIRDLPERYATRIGERGATLSGGQRQRLAIARAILKNAPVLILDEPTSALDAQTEVWVMEALARLMTGRTTFIIAHRLSTIQRANHIVVLDAGRIVEAGTHPQLLAAGGAYRRFYELRLGNRPAPESSR